MRIKIKQYFEIKKAKLLNVEDALRNKRKI